ncbi:MAG TPA: FMN-binding negative transcriptional regulator [Beijerinckiaceae bacterium]|jgi:transcriptional regulator
MYQPAHHREDRLDVQHALIRAFPLGTLVTNGPAGLVANHVPFLIDPERSRLGTLRAHVARANPLWKESDPQAEALVIFQGAERYVTPSWYATKRENGKVVPTWNYAVVHAYGRMTVIEDEGWLKVQIEDLTRFNEGPRAEPWAVSDAPEQFVAAMVRGIVGIEIEISRIEGKWKVSQNRPEADRRGVVEGLRADANARSEEMAELVEAFGGGKG